GDQLPDLIQYLETSSRKGYCFYPNNGDLYNLGADFNLFSTPRGDAICGNRGRYFAISELEAGDRISNLWLVDVNGDGLNDLVKLDRNTNADLRVWLGLGDGSLTSRSRSIALRTQISVGENQNRQVKFVDVDADGQKEILLLNQTKEFPIRVIDFNRVLDEQLPKSNLLTSVEYESSLRYDMRYSTSSDEYIRDSKNHNETDGEARRLHFPAVVLKKLSVSEGRIGEVRQKVQVTEYLYHDPYYNPENRKFQGFESVETLRYGDTLGTEGSSLTKSEYHAQENGERQYLAGQLKAELQFEFTPHGDYRSNLALDQSLDPRSSLLHALSQYTRNQEAPCGSVVNGDDSKFCKLRSKSSTEWEVVK
ncbi:MAG: hypothetical protein EOP04_30735, partial [Proteobacteria bacterium]